MNWPFWGRTIKVRCLDGTERLVYRNPDHAFPLFSKEWSTQVEATGKALEGLQGSLGVNFNSQVRGFLIQLDQANLSMQSQFRAIYVVYQTNPCGLDDYLVTQIRMIIERESILRKMQIEIRKLESLKNAGVSEQTLENALSASQSTISRSDAEEEMFREFQRTKKNISTWEEKTR